MHFDSVRFDSDTRALAHRERVNSRGERFSLDAWIMEKARPIPGMRVLELGCGQGKQTFRFAREVAPSGSVTALDISNDAVNHVRRLAGQSSGLGTVRGVVGSMDGCVEQLAPEMFDLIVSAYAIYYAADMVSLLIDLTRRLSPGGAVFVCGPGRGTNTEMVDIINDADLSGMRVRGVEDFISPTEITRVAASYRHSQTDRLANLIAFDSADGVIDWWRHHNSYRHDLEETVRARIEQRVSAEGTFTLTKNVLGVRFDT